MEKLFVLAYELMGYVLSGKITEKHEKLLENFVAQFRETAKKTVTKIAEAGEVAIATFVIYAFKVVPRTLTSFPNIVKEAGLNNGYYDWLEKNEKCRNVIFAPVANTEGEELVLYWEGENQSIPGSAEFYNYIAEKGYEVVSNAHPSLLVDSMKELTEEKLTALGIPSDVNVVLPTDKSSLLPDGHSNLCFLRVYRDGGRRELDLVRWIGEWRRRSAFLLRKKKLQPL